MFIVERTNLLAYGRGCAFGAGFNQCLVHCHARECSFCGGGDCQLHATARVARGIKAGNARRFSDAAPLQSNSPEDLKITQAIRQAVVKDESLTMTAKNVKIITAGGMVTLRGPVNTAEEKMKIDSIAKSVAGNSKVENQLEVKAASNK